MLSLLRNLVESYFTFSFQAAVSEDLPLQQRILGTVNCSSVTNTFFFLSRRNNTRVRMCTFKVKVTGRRSTQRSPEVLTFSGLLTL